jgi:FkbM family methyltransferase
MRIFGGSERAWLRELPGSCRARAQFVILSAATVPVGQARRFFAALRMTMTPSCLALRQSLGSADNAGRMATRLRYLYRAYRYRLRVNPAELRFVCQSLKAGQVAGDIGCHKGAYAYWMRRRVGPSGVVYAFEPQPQQVAYLREAFSAMRYDNVALVPMAVSDKRGEMPLYASPIIGRTHEASLEASSGLSGTLTTGLRVPCFSVDVTTLDEFFANESANATQGPRHGPDFLKIDVEGHELAVLDGARQTLEKHRPTILVECETRHRPDNDVRPVFELLKSFGYTGSFFLDRDRRPLTEFDPNVHQRLHPAMSGRLPRGYVSNFAFEPLRTTR